MSHHKWIIMYNWNDCNIRNFRFIVDFFLKILHSISSKLYKQTRIMSVPWTQKDQMVIKNITTGVEIKDKLVGTRTLEASLKFKHPFWEWHFTIQILLIFLTNISVYNPNGVIVDIGMSRQYLCWFYHGNNATGKALSYWS